MANKEGCGAIFKNNQKQSDKSPDYTGSITLNGKEIKLSCWVATSKLGTKYFSVKVGNSKQTTPKPQNEITDDEIPWN